MYSSVQKKKKAFYNEHLSEKMQTWPLNGTALNMAHFFTVLQKDYLYFIFFFYTFKIIKKGKRPCAKV